jgi:hypothetical protein
MRKIRHGFIAIAVFGGRLLSSPCTKSSRSHGPKRYPILPMQPLLFNRPILDVRDPRSRAEHLIAVMSSGPWTNAQPARRIAILAPFTRSSSS